MSLKVCRACTNTFRGTRDTVEILGNLYKKTYDLSLIIADIFSAKIEADDEISTKLCRSCADKIIELHRFCVMYRESDQKLRAALKRKHNQNSHTKPYGDDKNYVENIFIGETCSQLSRTIWECLVCAEPFKTERSLLKHQRNCERPIPMDDMDNDNIQQDLDVPLKIEVNTRPHTMLPKLSMEASAFTAHDESEQQRYQCNRCLVKCESIELLQSHKNECKSINKLAKIKSIETSGGSEWICEKCGEPMISKQALKDHRKAHREPKKYTENEETGEFVCDECGKGFNTKEKIQMHVRRHGDIRCLCNMCGKWLSCLGNLRKHYKAVHLNQKNLACPICDHRFTSSFRLKDHVNSHKGIRAYSCKLCETRFFNYSAVKRHMDTVHSDEKKFVCNVCSKAFKIQNNLKTHMFAHTGIYEHTCEHCGTGFRRKNKMMQHIQEMHGIET